MRISGQVALCLGERKGMARSMAYVISVTNREILFAQRNAEGANSAQPLLGHPGIIQGECMEACSDNEKKLKSSLEAGPY